MSNFPLINPLPTPVDYSTQPPQAASIDQTSSLSGKVDAAVAPQISAVTTNDASPSQSRLQDRQITVEDEPPKKRFKHICKDVFSSCTDSEALTNLAACYQLGIGVDKDLTIAAMLLKRAADLKPASLNNLDALCSLGWRHLYGDGVQKDEGEAITLFQRASSQNNPMGMTCLGLCYEKGLGVEANPVKAVELYKNAAALDYADAMYHLALCYNLGVGVQVDETKAAELYTRAEKFQHPDAINNLGMCYQNGRGVEKDPERAIKLFQRGEKLDNGNSTYNLALCYLYSEKIESMAMEIGRLLVKAVNLKHLNTIIALGNYHALDHSDKTLDDHYRYGSERMWDVDTYHKLYKNNIITIPSPYLSTRGAPFDFDIETAKDLFSQRHSTAMDSMHMETCLLADYFLGFYSEAEKKELRPPLTRPQLYRMAADIIASNQHNDPVAIFSYGLCYATNDGLDRNPYIAANLFERAAELNHADAALELGKCYENGYGVKQDSTKANNLFKKAADLKAAQLLDQPAKILALGKQYASGIDVEQNKIMVAHLYKKAADTMLSDQRNDPVDIEVALELGKCYENGRDNDKDKQVHAGELFYNFVHDKRDSGESSEKDSGVDRNVDQAVILFKKAANLMANQLLDHPEKLVSLGESYLKDEEILQNKSESWQDLDTNSEEDFSEEKDEKSVQDKTMACQLFLRGAELNNSNALFNLSICYAYGVGVDKNVPHALDLLHKAAKLSHPEAMTTLAILLIEGRVVPKDMQKAFNLVQEASHLENANAFALLSEFYSRGIVVQKDHEEASRLQQKAFDLGYAPSAYRNNWGRPDFG